MSDEKLLDLGLLAGYLENLGNQVVGQMLDLYVSQSQVYLEEIRAALEEGSQKLWQERCHKMKGAAGSVGFVQVHAKLVEIEKSTEPYEQKKQFIKALTDKNEAAIMAFKAWLA